MAKRPMVDDAAAVDRCRQGDQAAFGILVERYRALAVAVAFSVCRDRALAEDIAQDVFVRAYQKLEQLSRADLFCAWLMNIVRNAAVRASHNAARRDAVHRLATWGRTPDVPNPTEAMELAELLSRVDAEAQQMLTLRYVHDMTCSEVGALLGVPVGTVTSKISRAFSVLRRAVQQERRQ